MKKAFFADKVFLENEVREKVYVTVENAKFLGVSSEKPEGAQVIDYSGKWLAPGLVDTHIHGLVNYDVMDNDVEGLKRMSQGLLKAGVTSFLPTTLTSAVEDLNNTIENIGKHHAEVDGARIQGIFIEGPFFTEKYKGAQNPKYFMPPNSEILKGWVTRANGLQVKIAIAPEHVGTAEFVQEAVKDGVIIALAHSDAKYHEATQAVENGASIFIHTYNGMSGLHHREPGMVGAAMSLNQYAEIICDWHHVHPVSSKILMDAVGREKIVMISDSMKAAMMEDGTYNLGEFEVKVGEGMARLLDGTLAGSILLLKDALKNVVDKGLATPEQAIKMASLNPAKSAKIDHMCGKIKAGYHADFIVLSPEMEWEATYLGGEKKAQR